MKFVNFEMFQKILSHRKRYKAFQPWYKPASQRLRNTDLEPILYNMNFILQKGLKLSKINS